MLVGELLAVELLIFSSMKEKQRERETLLSSMLIREGKSEREHDNKQQIRAQNERHNHPLQPQ